MIVLSHVHNMRMWLDAPVIITRDVIHMVIGYPIIYKIKAIRASSKKEIEDNNKAR